MIRTNYKQGRSQASPSFPRTIYLCLFALVLTGCAGQTNFENVWQPLSLNRFEGTTDYPNRMLGSSPGLRADGDFDGDGEVDFVALSENTQTGAFAIVAQLSSKAHSGKPIVVHTYDWGDLTRIALHPVGPGTFETACSKGYGSRYDPCPIKFVTINNDGFYLFFMEASGRIVYWKDGAFHDIWISD